MKTPGRLHHQTPGWVREGAAFHIRIRAEASASLIAHEDARAPAIIAATRFYHEKQRWFCRRIPIMPDHLHAILSFPRDEQMSAAIKDRKSFLKRTHDVRWQDGYFDHRLRTPQGRGRMLDLHPAESDSRETLRDRRGVALGLVAGGSRHPGVTGGTGTRRHHVHS